MVNGHEIRLFNLEMRYPIVAGMIFDIFMQIDFLQEINLSSKTEVFQKLSNSWF